MYLGIFFHYLDISFETELVFVIVSACACIRYMLHRKAPQYLNTDAVFRAQQNCENPGLMGSSSGLMPCRLGLCKAPGVMRGLLPLL